MDSLVQLAKHKLYGGIYSSEYEEWSDGGPKCNMSMTVEFRIFYSAISAIINFSILKLIWNRVKGSREMDLTLVQNLKPSIIEKIIGYICFVTYFIMAGYKFATNRGIFMSNPCHFVCLFSGILLTTEKTKTKALLFITYLRWLFGPYFALIFPDLNGLSLPYEVEFFYIEHYLAAFIAPLTLMLCGRYGFFWKERFSTILCQQLFGFSIFILYQRFYMAPLSMLTWANLNYTLCYPSSDPFVPLLGNYYFIGADFYLNVAAFVTIIVHLLAYTAIRGPIILAKKMLATQSESKSSNVEDKQKNE